MTAGAPPAQQTPETPATAETPAAVQTPAAAPTPPLTDELAVGTAAPAFSLPGTDGKAHSLADYGDKVHAVAVVFSCNHCPYAKAYEPVLIDLAKKYADKGVEFVLISSNDMNKVPEDSFDNMKQRAKEKEYPFPYLFDETQVVAHAYGARVTPHVFLLDSKHVLRYRGRVNDKQDPTQVKSNDLVDALDALLAGKEIATNSTKAFGCGIKWKPAS
jgi:peroxiredoxin